MIVDPSTEFQTVATWVGLIGGVVSIVLSVVAIAFAVMVNNRATAVNDQTIQSLKKIEGDVEHLSDDTRELIKAGWDKMLGNVDRRPADSEVIPSKQIAAGIAAELKAELSPLLSQSPNGPTPPAQVEQKIDQLLRAVEGSMAAQLRAQSAAERPGEALDRLIVTLSTLSPEARALVDAMRSSHIDLAEYRRLATGPLRMPLEELRQSGLLIPVQHRHDGKDVPCYFFPPGIVSLVRAAIPLLPRTSSDLRALVRSELKRVGYPVEDAAIRPGRGHGSLSEPQSES
ncbi:MAG TPA: hypothetical protein VGM67_06330 [Gemmatimonadaceae bacterium]